MRAFLLAAAALTSLTACGDDARDREEAETAQVDEVVTPAPEPGTFDRSHAGEAMPDTTLIRQGGGPMSLQTYLGTPTLVNLWATWCAPCVAEMPALDALAGERGSALNVVLVSQDAGGWEQIEPFLGRVPIENAVVVADPDMELAGAYEAAGLPMTILYDEHGEEIWRYAGPNEWDEPGALEGGEAALEDTGLGRLQDHARAAEGAAYIARGQEPGWVVEVRPGDAIEVSAQYGELTATLPAPQDMPSAPFSIARADGGHSFAMAANEEPCTDPMSGRAYPHTVEIELDGRKFAGCGEPLSDEGGR